MFKQINASIKQFIKFFTKLPFSRQLLAVSFLLLTFLYPGQNYYQTLVIHPGSVHSYALPQLPSASYPISDGTAVPGLTAGSVVIQDVSSKNLIYAQNPDQSLLPASTTKIMTALVALDYYNLEDQITIRNEDRAVGSTMELTAGEVMTFENIMYGLLVESGNDAALALADNFPGGYDAFVSAMNTKARALHLDHTVYKNVSGIESYGHVTTARDLAVLASVAVENPVIDRIVQTKYITVTDVTGNLVHPLVSTNKLLGDVVGVKGLKTGWTEAAGECLVTYVERDGRRVILVVLNSSDRFGETAALIDWVYTHHTWQIIRD